MIDIGDFRQGVEVSLGTRTGIVYEVLPSCAVYVLFVGGGRVWHQLVEWWRLRFSNELSAEIREALLHSMQYVIEE